ncbi:Uncharacterized protein Rs2_04986 [Raphanus sativus]|nr:Uncharacterized protein Rs2_04986 [Raphanus sativus]
MERPIVILKKTQEDVPVGSMETDLNQRSGKEVVTELLNELEKSPVTSSLSDAVPVVTSKDMSWTTIGGQSPKASPQKQKQDVQEEGEIVEDEEEHLPVDSLVGTDLHKEENVGIGDKTESQRQGQAAVTNQTKKSSSRRKQ